MRRLMLIIYGLLLANVVGAATPPVPQPTDSSRPSAVPLESPGFAPDTAPAFTLPPVATEPSPVSPRFVLKAVRFTGHTVFSDAELQAVTAPFLGQAMTAGDLEELRKRLTRLYVDAGYLNSGAVLPDQPVRDGVVTFDLVEGRLTAIQVQGTERLPPAYVADRLWLGAEPPFNMNRLGERFQMLLEDPLISRMDGRLRPGDTPGESVLDVEVTRAKPYSLFLTADNYNPPSNGAERGGLSGIVRNLTGYGDALSAAGFHSQGYTDATLNFTVPLNARDTRVTVGFEYEDSTVIEEPLEPLDIRSESYNYEVGLSHPWINQLNRNLTLGVKLVYRENQTTLLGIPYSFSPGADDGESNVAAVRLVQDFMLRDAQQVFSARSTFSIGVDWLEATVHDDGRPDSEFLAWLGQTQYARRLGSQGVQVIARADVQFSNEVLLSAEQFSLGGATTVRGYRENTLVRDNGYLASLEFRYPLTSVNSSIGLLEGAVFTDYGRAWDKEQREQASELFSAGVGLLWTPFKRLNARLYIAHDLNEAPDAANHDLQDEGVHLWVSAEVF